MIVPGDGWRYGAAMATEIVSAECLTPAELAELFNRGYEGYFVPSNLTEETFLAMVRSQDVRLDSSCVILDGGNPVAFAMLAVRGRSGWIGGMGVVTTARGRGLGRAAMQAVLRRAAELGLECVDLEVLEANVWASQIYEALGFRDVRRLEVLERPPGPAPDAGKHAATPLQVAEALDAHARLCALRAPWQRAQVVLERAAPMLTAKGVRRDGRLVGVIVYRRDGERLPLLALSAEGGDGEVLGDLVVAVCAKHADAKGIFLNVPGDDPGRDALARAGFDVRLQQREMRVAAPFDSAA